MMESKRPKSCSNVEIDVDRISSLPGDVLNKILSHMPLDEVARTCVLSSKWRYKFVMLPCLVFDSLCSSRIVDHVLLNHIGPVSTFNLSQGCKDIRDLDRWLLHLSRYNLKVLILDFLSWDSQPLYKMPSCIFSWQDIVHLKLSNCLLKPPSTFKGFRSLKSLNIERVTLAQDVLQSMIQCCPGLERLTLYDCDGFIQIKIEHIHAPNLEFLYIYGSNEDFSVVNLINLAEVSIGFDRPQVPWSYSRLIKFFDDLPCIQKLLITSRFLMYLAAGALLEKLPKPCQHLKSLGITIRFDDREDILTALCLLRSSPALEKLELCTSEFMAAEANVSTVSSCLDDYRSYSCTQLRHVKIYTISGLEAQLDFIQFLLLCSPVLETFTVNVEAVDLDADESLALVKKLIRLKRASGNVEMIYIDDISVRTP